MDIGRYEVIRATELWQRAGAYSVRIQGLARQYHISPWDEFDEHDGEEGTLYIVILDGTYPIATCRMYPLGEGRMSVGRVVVLEEYRGQGLGRKVMEEAERWLRELGTWQIELDSRVNAVGFYEKLGYKCVDGAVSRGKTFDTVKMIKDLRGE